jgi:hypothetical protein
MFLCVNDKNYEQQSILFSKKIKNNILSDGYFYKIYYSDKYFTSNGLLFLFDLKDIKVDNYFNRVKCMFCSIKNKKILNFIKNLERRIIEDFNFESKFRPIYRIEEQLKNEYIKIFSDEKIKRGKINKIQVLLKISGIWNNEKECGITFRFLV